MKIPITPVLLASLSLASSSLAAPTSKKPDCESPRIGERSPLLGRDVWEPALHLKGVGGQGRPWGQMKRDDTPTASPQAGASPTFGTTSTPLLGNTGVNAAANPDPVADAAAGLLAPVTGLVGSTAGTLKGVLGTTTSTLNGLLGNTPLGPLVGTVGGIGNGVLDKVGTIGNGGLGLGTILKPVGDTLNGLPIVGPIVGPIAGGLAGTVGGLSVAQQSTPTPTPNVTPQVNQYGQFAGTAMPTTQEVQETIVGRLADGRLVTNTGRLLGVANGGVGQGGGVGEGLQPPTRLDGAGQILRPIISNPGAQGPLSGLPGLGDLGGGALPTLGNIGGAVPQLGNIGGQLGNIGGTVPQLGNIGGQLGNIGGQLGTIGGGLPSTDLGKIVANLPPGLGQILQPVGSAEKYLQIGNQLIPLGNLDAGQLAQLGLDRLPVTPVNAGFGYPSVNHLQDGEEPESDPQSKEVQANPVTSWMEGGNSTSTDLPAANSTMPENPDNAAVPEADGSMLEGSLATESQMPMAAQMQVQPLELAPPSMVNNQTVAGKPHSIIKGESAPWYNAKIDGGDTFQRIAAEMSGQENNYYGGGNRDMPVIVDPKPEDHRGWQELSSSAYSRPATATGTMLSSTFAAPTPAPTPAPENDAGTFAWSEDWGDWVSADYDDDSGLRVGWDEPFTYPASASATTSVPNPTSSTMSGGPSAGIS